ncbi:MAG: CxxxxCH/CxxCH domain-containing protein, partial [Nitrospirota bacterium]
MKRYILLMTAILMALIGMFTAAQNAFAVDPPHNGQNSLNMPITCTSCHYDTAGPTPSWATQPTTTDETFYNNLCTSCHMPSQMTDSRYVVKTHSSQNSSGNYAAWTVECRRCHNPHLQDQVSSYPTDSTAILATGTIVSYAQVPVASAQSTIVVSAGLTPNAWVDHILVPNISYPTKMYHIRSNTNNSITVSGAIDGRYARATVPPTIYVIKTGTMVIGQLQTPSGIASTVKFFTNNPTQLNSYASSTDPGNVTGICQVCHTQTKSFNRTNVTGSIQAGLTHPVVGTQVCTGCHIHTEGFKGECNACHGYPPDSTATLIFKNKTGATVTSDSGAGPGAHATHVDTVKLVCANCHANGMLSGATAGDDNINIGFNWNGDTNGNYDGKASRTVYPYTPPVTTGNTYLCSNLYCHSSGQGSTSLNATPVYKQPKWNDPSTGACGTCHGKTVATLTTGNHAQHLGATTLVAGCAECHAGAANDASSYDSTNHINRLIDVANGYTAAGTAGNGYGSCNAAACHGSGTPQWGMNTTGMDTCTLCHGTPTAGTLGSSASISIAPPFDTARSSTSPTVGAHQAHLRTGNISSAVPCQECHIVPTTIDQAGHIKDGTPGVAEVVFTGADRANFNGATPNYAAGTCSTTYCHGAKMPKTTTTGADITPSWGDTNYINGTASHDCAMCHGYPPSPNVISAHGTTAVPVAPTTCTNCHSHTMASGTGFYNINLHINKVLEVSGCNGCHGQGGPTGAPISLLSELVTPSTHLGQTVVGAHNRHVTSTELNYTCQVCHAGHTMPALDTVLTMSFSGSLAAGGTYDGKTLQPPYSYSANVTLGTPLTLDCNNLYCHSSGQSATGGAVPTYANPNWESSVMDCGSCHNNMDSNSSAPGSHVQHAQTSGIACATCHNGYTETTTGATHVDRTVNVNFSGPGAGSFYTGGTTSGDHAVGGGYGRCQTSACHSSGQNETTGAATPLSYGTPTWGTTLACNSCHRDMDTDIAASGSHRMHAQTEQISCASCHNGYTETTTAAGTHNNGSINLSFITGISPTTGYSQ